MIPSQPFISRPVATTLLTLAVFLAGLLAYKLLPVAPLPQVDFPTISVQARMAGASPETMAATVATPLERSLGRIAGVTEITSSSSLGSTRVTLQFDLSRDIDGAARDVQAAINAARVMLPTGLSGNPTYRKVNPADAPMMIIGLTSDSLTRGQMYDAADSILAQKILQIEGVGDVNVGGGAQPAVRVAVNPLQINHLGISLEKIRSVITNTNANRPKGLVEDAHTRWQITANDQAKTAAEYAPLIISYQNGSAVRLADVASVTDSVINTRNAGFVGKQPSVMLIVTRQPGANMIETVERIRAALPALQAAIPPAIKAQIVLDRTTTIRASLEAVNTALLTSLALVIMVVFIFLRNGRATMIPAITVPVSLVGTFAVMYLAGFSLNNLSLMALTIATGFVVDDTIVVLENITRHIENGLTPLQASLRGAREVGFTVVSMSISLVAVFLPILMMGGILGRLFREFAGTLAVAIAISLVVSLTTTPMLCARWLKPQQKSKNFFHRATENGLAAMQRGYERSLKWALRHSFIVALTLLATIGLNVYLYVIVPKGFFPQQDTGTLIGNVRADQNISFQAMQGKLQRLIAIVQKDKAVANVTGFTGGGQTNSANIFVALKPLSERGESADKVIARLRRPLSNEPGAQLFLQSVQDIRMGGRQTNAQYQYTLQGDDLNELRSWTPRVQQALSKLPELSDINSDQESKGLQTSLDFNRDTMTRLGITQAQVDATLNNAFGQRQVSTIYNPLNQYKVVLEVAPEFAVNADSLNHIYLSSSSGEAVALSSIASWKPTSTSLSVNHQSQFAAATISFNLPQGVSLSDATVAIQNTMAKIGVPSSIYGSFQGTAKTFQASLDSQPLLILMAIVAVYIVLGMLYESVVHPVTIISTLPSAGVGALLALLLTGGEFNVIALIGILLLVGIVKKNAIMMVDFALAAEREQNLNSHDAILQACILRFRPIMMTTLAALFGALPLALGRGDGSEMRVPLGVAVVGGLVLSQILTLYTTPVVYMYFDRFRHWATRWRQDHRPVQTQRSPVTSQ